MNDKYDSIEADIYWFIIALIAISRVSLLRVVNLFPPSIFTRK